MRALTVEPGTPYSARVEDVAEPPTSDGALLVQAVSIGVCGTDLDIVEGCYGCPPSGHRRMILGHESLGRVQEAPPATGWSPGDLVVGIVRRPDPEPCASCAAGEWDMCRNGRYTERGIKERDGYASDLFRLEPEFAVKVPPTLEPVGVLVEPASVVAKAWAHAERIGRRARWQPSRVLVTGAGPIGLLAALMAVQRGLDVHVLDRVTAGPKPDLVQALGASYHTSTVAEAAAGADIVFECTGAAQLAIDAMRHTAPGGIVCLAGLSSGRREVRLDAAALTRMIVLENDVVFGSVNANRSHYEAAVETLAGADRGWLEQLITRRAPLTRWAEALEPRPTDVKTVIDLAH